MGRASGQTDGVECGFGAPYALRAADAGATVTIVDPTRQFSIADASVKEGDSGVAEVDPCRLTLDGAMDLRQFVLGYQALLAEGIIVRDFGTAPGLRVTLGTSEDMDVTCAAFRAAASAIGI